MSVTFFTTDIDGTDTDGMNVSNANARAILHLIGEESASTDDLCGSWAPVALPALQAKIELMVRALRATPEFDLGRDVSVSHEEGQPLLIDCGLPAGYFEDRLMRLLQEITVARRSGRPVHFS
jgi:hypothetical protein